MLVDAILMQFINLGERIGSLSESFKSAHPNLPYHKAKAMRNVISHQYDGVNLATVWLSIEKDVPA